MDYLEPFQPGQPARLPVPRPPACHHGTADRRVTPPNWRNADQWIVTCLACHGELAVLPAQDVGGLCKHCACPRSLHPHRQCAVIQIAAEDWT